MQPSQALQKKILAATLVQAPVAPRLPRPWASESAEEVGKSADVVRWSRGPARRRACESAATAGDPILSEGPPGTSDGFSGLWEGPYSRRRCHKLEALPIGHRPLPEDQRARPSSRSFRLTKGPLPKAKGPLKYDKA